MTKCRPNITVDKILWDKFKALCEDRQITCSKAVSKFMASMVNQAERIANGYDVATADVENEKKEDIPGSLTS